jgi:hypothetical protein
MISQVSPSFSRRPLRISLPARQSQSMAGIQRRREHDRGIDAGNVWLNGRSLGSMCHRVFSSLSGANTFDWSHPRGSCKKLARPMTSATCVRSQCHTYFMTHVPFTNFVRRILVRAGLFKTTIGDSGRWDGTAARVRALQKALGRRGKRPRAVIAGNLGTEGLPACALNWR